MIGIMDWGIGGLGVYRALRAKGAAVSVVYLSDSGTTPYGKMRREGLRQRFRDIGRFFKSRRVDSVLVACHAASSALNSDRETFHEVEFRSIAPYTHQAAASSRGRCLGVIGGALTISSGVYQRRMSDMLEKTFIFQSAQPLSALVEAGQDPTSESVLGAVTEVLQALGPIDALVLACTHYPALLPAFQKLAPDLEYLDPADQMVETVDGLGSGELLFNTTGPTQQSLQAAQQAFGIRISSVTQLDLATLEATQ